MSSNPPPPDDINAQIVTTTQRLFQLTPREWQIGIIRDLVHSHRSNIKSNMLIVRPTGGGKSLVYQVAGYLMKGITLFISPLLALVSDQVRKLHKVMSTRPNFVSLHLAVILAFKLVCGGGLDDMVVVLLLFLLVVLLQSGISLALRRLRAVRN